MLDFNQAERQTLEPPSLAVAALGYATRGLPVFPCTLEKKPLTASGFKNATADQEQIRQWWTRHPGASIGIPTGADTGVFVLDIDMPDGPATLERLMRENGPLPATLEQRTGSGGRHLFFTHPGRPIKNSAGKLGPGLDTRGDGGYVILPPSQHPSGNPYEWTTSHPTAEAPAWLLEKLTERHSEKPAPIATGGEYGRAALARELAELTGAAEGSRNSRLNTAAFSLGQLVAGGELDRGQVGAALTAAAASIGLPHQEAAATIASGLEGGSREPRTAPEKPATLPPAPTRDPATGGQPEGREIVFSDIADDLLHPTEPRYLVEGVVEEQTTGALFGESTSGKSFVAVGLACSCATGTPWARHQVLQAGPVIYFAGEGRQGIPRRVAAWQEQSGVTVPHGRFFLPKGRIEFDAAGARMVAEAVEKLAQKHGNPVLLIIDTLARALPAGSDENSARDMMDFINAVDGLRERFGCVAVIVHHSGHGEDTRGRARGSSTFRAAMDFEILVEKKGLLSWKKMKDAELPRPIPFELQSAGLSAAVVYGEPQQHQTGPTLTRAEQLAVETLTETTERLGRKWATVEEWRVDFYRRHHAADLGAKRKAFNRARGDLVEKGVLILDNDTYAIAGHAGQRRDTSRNVSEDTAGQTGHPPIKGVSCPAPCPGTTAWVTEDL